MTERLSTQPQKVLFLALSGIGNFLMQSPTWQTLKKVHPDWQITLWVAPRHTKELAQLDHDIDHVIEAPIKNSLLGHLKTLRRLRRQHYDIGFVLSPGQHFKSAAYLYLAGIPRRVGHTYPLRQNPHSKFLLTDAINEADSLHDIEQNLRLITTSAPGKPLVLTDKHQGLRRRSDYQLPITKNTPYYVMSNNRKPIGFHPGSAANFLWKNTAPTSSSSPAPPRESWLNK
jgi:ADP-heptose:LPS heptosyltransferase